MAHIFGDARSPFRDECERATRLFVVHDALSTRGARGQTATNSRRDQQQLRVLASIATKSDSIAHANRAQSCAAAARVDFTYMLLDVRESRHAAGRISRF